MRSTFPIVALLLSLAAFPAAAQETSSPAPVPPPMEGVLGPAANLPDRFTPKQGASDPVPFGDRVCPVEYQDVRDGTVLRLIRSVSSKITHMEGDRRITVETSYGDYWIADENSYGIELGRALRIDCVAGKGIGIVARFE